MEFKLDRLLDELSDIEKNLAESSSCGGFENCETFYDGCNNCLCRNGLAACTLKFCFKTEPSRCTKCAPGYTLSANSCV